MKDIKNVIGTMMSLSRRDFSTIGGPESRKTEKTQHTEERQLIESAESDDVIQEENQ